LWKTKQASGDMTSSLRSKDGHAREIGSAPDHGGMPTRPYLGEAIAPMRLSKFNSLPPEPLTEQPVFLLVLSSLSGLVRRQARLIVVVTVLTSAVASVGVSKLKTYYTATSSVILDQRDTRPLQENTKASSVLPPLNPDGEVELLKSDNVALRVVERLRLDEDPEFVPPSGRLTRLISAISAWFPGEASSQFATGSSAGVPLELSPSGSTAIDEASLSQMAKPISERTARALRRLTSHMMIRRRGLSDIIAIQASSTSPLRAAQIANAYAEAYLEEQVAPKFRGIERVERVLSRQLAELDQELKRSEVQFGLRQIYQDTQLRLRTVAQQRDNVTPDARIASLALPPSAPSVPFVKFFGMVGSIMASFGLALGIGYLRDLHTRRVQTPDELERFTGVANLAAVPTLRRFGHSKTFNPADTIVEQPTSSYADAVRRLYFNLQMSGEEGSRLGTILVTSTERKEGRTTLALSLARSAAGAGARAIVIDCDLQSPAVHEVLNIRNKVGLVDLLARSCDEQSVIQDDPKSSCQIIVGGNAGSIPSDRLLRSDRLGEIFRKLEADYDLVVLDVPPVKRSTDALILMSYADLALFVTRTGWATPTDIQSCIQQLRCIDGVDTVTVLNFTLT
jgi:capsular exopolysaccharide synthesis family protein